MNDNLENKLYNKFDFYFINGGGPTYYYIPLECNDGWFNIIWDCCEKIKKINSGNNFKFSQIKEKFGSLRLYHYGATDEIDKIINETEKLSQTTCEYCGKTTTIKEINKWYFCICDECKERMYD